MDTDFGTANDDGVYTTYGVGSQGNNSDDDSFGRVFFEYTDQAVQTLYIQNFVTDPKQEGDTPDVDDQRSSGTTSMSIGQNIVFTKANTEGSEKVPEPSIILGLIAVAGMVQITSNK